jgi:hypothetical protein
MEESVSGFKQRGEWGDVVEHGERITEALRRAGVDGGAFEEWNEWRPKSHERLGEDVKEKTAAQAHVGEGKGEQAGESPGEDLQTAGEKVTESYEKLADDDAESAVERWQDSIDYVARAADSAGRKMLRSVEDTVYEKVMTRFTPYYFDNELVSANLQWVRSQDEFELEVNVNDDDLRDAVREHLHSFEDIDRWHVGTEKETETVEAAEGVEPPETEEEAESKSTMT